MSPELFLNIFSGMIQGDLLSIYVIETYQNKSVNSNNDTENTGGESPPAAEKNGEKIGGGSPSGGG
jgi:hypothetical protein